MPFRRVAFLAVLVGALAVPAGATPRQLELLPGHSFRVAGTRVGCWVVTASAPAAQPSVECGLWGRTTRIIPGTLASRTGEDAAEVYQRPLDGELSLRVRLVQPVPPGPAGAPPPIGDPARTTTLSEGEVAKLAGTDLSCAVIWRGELGARCGRVDPGTGVFVASSALVTVTQQSALAARVNPRGLPSTIFYQRQPFIPSVETVDRALRELAHAERRLAALRRAYHGTRSGYRKARATFEAIQADLRHDRYLAACPKFSPLLYNSFYLPRGSVNEGAGHWYLHSVRRIQTALCG
jgi:hypothetical protein